MDAITDPIAPVARIRPSRGRLHTGRAENLRSTIQLDQRSALGRAATAFEASLLADLGGTLTARQRALVDMCVQLRLRCLMMEDDARRMGTASGHDNRVYVSLVNALDHKMAMLGLEAGGPAQKPAAEPKAEPTELADYVGSLE
jgi:hypothetical protein